MTEFIGVAHRCGGPRIQVPKKELLFFDKIAYIGLDNYIDLEMNTFYGKPRLAREFIYLKESGYIFDPFEKNDLSETAISGVTELETIQSQIEKNNSFLHSLPSDHRDAKLASRAWRVMNESSYLQARLFTEVIRRSLHLDAYNILEPPDFLMHETADRATVAQISFKRMPLPDEETPWENIIAFRNDPDSTERRLGLRTWISDMARGQLTVAEAEQKLDYLLLQYENTMRFYSIKYHYGMLRTIAVAIAEVIESLVTFKWSKLADRIFTVGSGNIELFEAERKAPGREVSYIVKARSEFGGNTYKSVDHDV